MRYIDVVWKHDLVDEPIRLLSEIGADNFEIRKIEIFRDGSSDYADSIDKESGTMLGIVEVPTIESINAQGEFEGKEITKYEFEHIWQKYCQSNS